MPTLRVNAESRGPSSTISESAGQANRASEDRQSLSLRRLTLERRGSQRKKVPVAFKAAVTAEFEGKIGAIHSSMKRKLGELEDESRPLEKVIQEHP